MNELPNMTEEQLDDFLDYIWENIPPQQIQVIYVVCENGELVAFDGRAELH